MKNLKQMTMIKLIFNIIIICSFIVLVIMLIKSDKDE
jgi:hypothetical protein